MPTPIVSSATVHRADATLPPICLRAVTTQDIGLVHEWLSSERVYPWLDMGAGRQLVTPLQLQSLMMSRRAYPRMVFTPDGAAFGLVCLSDIENLMGSAELWYLRGRHDARPSGVMKAAILSVLASGFVDLNREVIGAWVAEENDASLHIQRSIGMQQCGRQRARHVRNGQRFDRILFDMTRAEFGQRYPRLVSEQGLCYKDWLLHKDGESR